MSESANERSAVPSGSVLVPRELFEWLVEYALEVQSQSGWKIGYARYEKELADLERHCREAVALRDTPNNRISQ